MKLRNLKNYFYLYSKYKLIIIFITIINFEFLLATNSYGPILWSTQNRMFESLIKDKTKQKEYVVEVRIGEFLNIICPKFSMPNNEHHLNDYNEPEYHSLYQVTKEEYNECKVNNIENKHPILKCDRPYDNIKYTLYISKFSPVPDAIEFIPGNSYYIISTSNGSLSGLLNSKNGACKSNNMKLIINVIDNKNVDFLTKKPKPNYPKIKNITSITSSNQSNKRVWEASTMQTKEVIFNKISSFSYKNTTEFVLLSKTVVESTRKESKTVDDNIFILEPDSIDYNDILSQLISSSSSFASSLNNSENFNYKFDLLEPTKSINSSAKININCILILFLTFKYLL